jgi:DNA-binding GntR family transcriptional regulator
MPFARPYYAIVEDWGDRKIVTHSLPPGTRLTVSSVAQRLGLSRSPVKRTPEVLAQGRRLTTDARQGHVAGAHPAPQAPVADLFELHLSDPPT